MTDLAVISVFFNGEPGIRRWLEALRDAWNRVNGGNHHLTVIAVDNASGDGTAELLAREAPSIRVLRQPANHGFAAGCNRGLHEVADGVIVVLLNPDVVVTPTFFERLVNFDWTPGLAAVGPQVRTPAGDVEQSARCFPSMTTGLFGRNTLLTHWFPQSRFARRQLLAVPHGPPRSVDWVSGACLIAPRASFDEVGPLDEHYWMYWEDADWCRRASSQGLRVEYRPELLAVHHQGSSSSNHPFRTTVAFHRSAARYYSRYVARSPLEARLATAVLAGRSMVKLTAAAARVSAARARRLRS